MKDTGLTEAGLLALYDRVAEAEDAIPRLRRFVLDLAVRGKLVPQDAGDEPAPVLLERIEKEKARLSKAGEIRKAKDFPSVSEPPFDLPSAWAWTRIRQVTTERGQTVPSATFTYIDVSAINKEAGTIEAPTVLEPQEAPSRARKIARKGDVIYSCVRPYLLNVAVLESEIQPAPIVSTAFAVLNGMGLLLPRYIWIVLRSPFMVGCVEETQRGQAYPAINDADFAVLPFPLPPLAEQHRIVAKVEALMALLDRLEAARAAREETRTRLTAATLSRLTEAEADTPTAARFALQTLPALTTREDQIKTLRQTILNLAVRGKLVEQDEGGEPITRTETTQTSTAWPIPATWSSMMLEAVLAEGTRNGHPRKPDDATDGIPILRISAGTLRSDGIVAEEEHKLIGGISEAERHQFALREGDLLACRFNGNKDSVGRFAIFKDYLGLKPIYPDKLIRVRINQKQAIPDFIRLCGDADLVRSQVEKLCATTVGNWGVSASNLKEVIFTLPPLAEQHRIVAKVEELMSLCDRLETALRAAATTRARLLDATLRDALAGAQEAA